MDQRLKVGDPPLCILSLKCSPTSVEVNEEEEEGHGVHAGDGDERLFGTGRVKAPPPPGCCPGVAWQRREVFCPQGNNLEQFRPYMIAGEAVQPVEVEDGKACGSRQE